MNTPDDLGFWFEFGSTYSYLSAARIEDAAAAAGVRVSWQPFLLGPIFKEQGWDDSPFNVYPAKGRYMWRDVERLCAGYGIPFIRPSRFPRSGLLAARVACLASATSERWLPDFVRAVFRANFAEDREIGDPAEVRSILDSLGQPGAELVERAQAPENKRRLRDRTRRAGELGIFGAPSFVVGGELFWGNDRLEDALAWARRQTVRSLAATTAPRRRGLIEALVDNFRTLAMYNTLANRRLYDACALLPDEERKRRRPAFFGSIHGTLNHLMVGDRIWLARFSGEEVPSTGLDAILYEDFAELRRAREAEDARIETFVAGLDERFLAGTIRYVNNEGRTLEDPVNLLVTHFFNHQTHHRGQLHDMLSQTNVSPPVLNLHRVIRP